MTGGLFRQRIEALQAQDAMKIVYNVEDWDFDTNGEVNTNDLVKKVRLRLDLDSDFNDIEAREKLRFVDVIDELVIKVCGPFKTSPENMEVLNSFFDYLSMKVVVELNFETYGDVPFYVIKKVGDFVSSQCLLEGIGLAIGDESSNELIRCILCSVQGLRYCQRIYVMSAGVKFAMENLAYKLIDTIEQLPYFDTLHIDHRLINQSLFNECAKEFRRREKSMTLVLNNETDDYPPLHNMKKKTWKRLSKSEIITLCMICRLNTVEAWDSFFAFIDSGARPHSLDLIVDQEAMRGRPDLLVALTQRKDKLSALKRLRLRTTTGSPIPVRQEHSLWELSEFVRAFPRMKVLDVDGITEMEIPQPSEDCRMDWASDGEDIHSDCSL